MTKLVEALIKASLMVIGRPDVEASIAARAAALMTRQALEQTLAARLAQEHPNLGSVTMRAQLLVFHSISKRLAEETAAVWVALTRACHHHHYELTPTPEEMKELLTDAHRIIVRLSDATSTSTQHA